MLQLYSCLKESFDTRLAPFFASLSCTSLGFVFPKKTICLWRFTLLSTAPSISTIGPKGFIAALKKYFQWQFYKPNCTSYLTCKECPGRDPMPKQHNPACAYTSCKANCCRTQVCKSFKWGKPQPAKACFTLT